MTGTANQIELAEQIKSRLNAEFDRVAQAFHGVAQIQTGLDRVDTWAIIEILEEKRAEVMAIDQAGYFIREWGEADDQVRQMIGEDARYQAIRTSREMRRTNCPRATVEGWKE